MEFSLCRSTVLRREVCPGEQFTYQGSHILIENCLFSPRSYQISVIPQLVVGFRATSPPPGWDFVRLELTQALCMLSQLVWVPACNYAAASKTKNRNKTNTVPLTLPPTSDNLSVSFHKDSEGSRGGVLKGSPLGLASHCLLLSVRGPAVLTGIYHKEKLLSWGMRDALPWSPELNSIALRFVVVLILFYVYECFACMFVYAAFTCLMLVEARRGRQIP